MSIISKLLASLSSKELSAISSPKDLESMAKVKGVAVSASEVISFLKAQQNNAANGNMSTDGAGAIVFGRDWYYPGPAIDPENII
ncbi:hypothetical protein BMR04_13455 [Methylococcaceae bacterium HT3]|nr:hypothetical protein BMR04_13455 [Methylococcaceae bacterium HT3]